MKVLANGLCSTIDNVGRIVGLKGQVAALDAKVKSLDDTIDKLDNNITADSVVDMAMNIAAEIVSGALMVKGQGPWRHHR